MMSEITVVGLGLMGAALARAMQNAGHDLTVWNRSSAKMQPFIDDGVVAASDLAAAITSSPIVLICIDNYAVSNGLLGSADIVPFLAGRTVVQLSTGTPAQARASAGWMAEHEVFYLDGAILAGPSEIGTDASQILLSGDTAAYQRAGEYLQCLGGRVRYLGDNVGAASVLDLAWLCDAYGRYLAVTHAARLCESEDVGLDDLASVYTDGSMIRHNASILHSADFENCTATLKVWGGALKHIQQQGRDAGINTDFPDLAAGLFEKAVDAGYGEEHVMALIKVLRNEG